MNIRITKQIGGWAHGWSYHIKENQKGCTNPAYLQPCDNLVTTLLQPSHHPAGVTIPGF